MLAVHEPIRNGIAQSKICRKFKEFWSYVLCKKCKKQLFLQFLTKI